MSQSNDNTLPVHIRWMIARDFPEVLSIEYQSFEFPWTEGEFRKCLRQRNCIGMVAEHDERVVAFMIYELHSLRFHLLTLATAPDVRRHNIGRQMIEKLVGKLASQRRTQIWLEVRETNVDAQLFFRSQGFKAITVLHEFYEDTPEDAYLMEYRREESSEVKASQLEESTA